MRIRKATIADAKEIRQIVNEFARKEFMLPLAFDELYEGIRDFIVSEDNGSIRGVCALHLLWDDNKGKGSGTMLAEIRSLAVKETHQSSGIGKSLVRRCIKEAEGLGVRKVFALTYRPEFFKKLGFKEIERAKLPHRVWEDCRKCYKFPECDEHAVILTLSS
ncbi:MAG: N-acetyltransferase [Nitrospirae bacterium]|nr:N-acetyltransferase [Nitrospirota bacterium]